KVVLVLLSMALGSLSVAFWAFPSDEGKAEGFDYYESAKKSSNEQPLTTVEGAVVDMKTTKSGGHLLISLDSTTLKVFVSRSAGAEEMSAMLKNGDRIRARGMQKEYQGREEIEVSRISDVQILNR
ncbi:MAG: hypothetical protein MUE87_03460, partial [Methanothrix sp.]|nr:hypothetical protein [Methanothrix sp.]